MHGHNSWSHLKHKILHTAITTYGIVLFNSISNKRNGLIVHLHAHTGKGVELPPWFGEVEYSIPSAAANLFVANTCDIKCVFCETRPEYRNSLIQLYPEFTEPQRFNPNKKRILLRNNKWLKVEELVPYPNSAKMLLTADPCGYKLDNKEMPYNLLKSISVYPGATFIIQIPIQHLAWITSWRNGFNDAKRDLYRPMIEIKNNVKIPSSAYWKKELNRKYMYSSELIKMNNYQSYVIILSNIQISNSDYFSEFNETFKLR